MLAIVIPYYRLAFFEATLHSLANQTDKHFKVYIGNDASPDDPWALLQNFEGKFDFSYFRFERNLGSKSLTKQWERCLEKVAHEDWIMILGDDDTLDANCVLRFNQEVTEAFSMNVVRFATDIIDENGHQMRGIFTHPQLEKSTDFLMRKFGGKTRSSLGEYVFRKSRLLSTGFRDFPLAWHSDEMALLECSEFGAVFTINDAVAHIRESNLSISGTSDNFELKQLATFQFCSSLIKDHSSSFTVLQRGKLLQRIEKYYFRNREKRLFIKIGCWYLSKTGTINFIKFVRRFLLSLKAGKQV